jgi:hypothetical protein
MQRVKLDAADAARLRKLTVAQESITAFVKTVVQAGETRAAAIQQEGADLYRDLAAKYNLDLDRVVYKPSGDGAELIPIQMRLDEDA